MTDAATQIPPSAAAELPPAIECEAHPHPGRPLHVAIPLGGTDLGRSGIGTYVRELLPPLIARVRVAGGRVTVFGRRPECRAFAAALAGADLRVPAFLTGNPGLNAAWHLTRAGNYARALGADVLLLPAANRRIVRTAPLPTVAVVHDLAQLRVARKYDPLRMAYFNRVLLPAFRRPTQLIAVSAATREDLVQTLGLARDRVRVVYNGVNAAQFRAVASDAAAVANARREAGVADTPYLLYPARLEHPGKNHLRLLQAFADSGLVHSHRLVLSGADWGAGNLIRTRVRELGLGDAVTLVGFVAPERLPALVAGADAVLMLGLHEGFGLPPLEALSIGRPVCVANTGALPEVVGPHGVQCNPLDVGDIARALQHVVSDPVVRTRCHAEGPAWADRFTWTRTAEGVFEACQEAAEVFAGA